MRWWMILLAGMICVFFIPAPSNQDTISSGKEGVHSQEDVKEFLFNLAVTETQKVLRRDVTSDEMVSAYTPQYHPSTVEITTDVDLLTKRITEIVTYDLSKMEVWYNAPVYHCWDYAVGRLIYIPFCAEFDAAVSAKAQSILAVYHRDNWIHAIVNSSTTVPVAWEDKVVLSPRQWSVEILYCMRYPERSKIFTSVAR